MNVSARDAFDALQLGPVAHPDRTIHEIEQALSVVPIDSRTRLTDGLLAPLLTDREWQALRATLIAWADSAFNISRAADRLHVHRNTLIYRLDKVARILRRSLDEPGLAVRSVRDVRDGSTRSAADQPLIPWNPSKSTPVLGICAHCVRTSCSTTVRPWPITVRRTRITSPGAPRSGYPTPATRGRCASRPPASCWPR